MSFVWFRKFEFKACEARKIKEFTFVNDCFSSERNEEIGHYGQTLIKNKYTNNVEKTRHFLINNGFI